MTKLLTSATTGKSNITHRQFLCIELIDIFLLTLADFFSTCLHVSVTSGKFMSQHGPSF